MKQFISKTLLLIIVLITLIFGLILLSSLYVKEKGFNNYTSESNLLFLPENENFDLLFLGISHARNFSRHKNHLRIEEILNSKIINLGQGGNSCGVNEQLFYLDYFYYKGNSANKIIYVLSPPLFFARTLPIASNTFDKESFELPFIYRYLFFESENKMERIISYLQSKLKPKWLLLTRPKTKEFENRSLESIDLERVAKGQNYAYGGAGLDMSNYDNTKVAIENTVRLAILHDSEVILLIPPALFGKWRGHDETMLFANEMKTKYPNTIKVLDGSETVLEPHHYYDNHHMNTKGVVYFVQEFLKPFIE